MATVRAETSIFDRLPPQNIEAEQAVLGSMLLDNDVIHDIVHAAPADVEGHLNAPKLVFTPNGSRAARQHHPSDLAERDLRAIRRIDQDLLQIFRTLPVVGRQSHEHGILADLIAQDGGRGHPAHQRLQRFTDALRREAITPRRHAVNQDGGLRTSRCLL